MNTVNTICPHCKKTATSEDIGFRRFPTGSGNSTFFIKEDDKNIDVLSESIEKCPHCDGEYLYRLSLAVVVKTSPINFE